ncbi:MAG: mechanosensitive ion channel [Candidatus Lokiarchaeota archaeon]|nr:mechanosensitive ion channel [Candidatus Lokiarchaeota archaeon]
MAVNQAGPEAFFSYLLWWSVFVGVLLVVFVAYKVVVFFLKRFVSRFKLSPNVVNGVRFVVRLIVVLVVFSTFISMSWNLIPGGIPVEVALIISTAIGTVFALSATTVVQNFVAGIYIILTRPFNVGDLVRINEYEGIVDEISLNHTKLRLRSGGHYFISNQAIINSKIANFSLPVHEHEGIMRGPRNFKDELVQREITRYAFSIELPKADPERTKKAFSDVEEQFKGVFSQPIRFVTTAYLHKVIVSVILVSEDPELVLKQRDGVVEALYERIFK